ncbi:MAG: heme ABC transporter permease CcmB [Calditrichaeota bacterium]|nr:heme ABC transporter permease CcmB [Calditrichota bacterium]
MEENVWTLLVKSNIIFQKDFHLEFRTRYAINAIILFAVISLTAVSFSIGPMQLDPPIQSAMLWIIIFFSAMSGLAHIFVREEEQQTSDTLRLVAPPTAIFLGKWVFNVVLLFSLEIIVIPLYIALLNVDVQGMGAFLTIIILGSVGLASIGTIMAAIVAQASTRGALFAVLSFPLSIPVLRSAIQGTWTAIQGGGLADCLADIQLLFSFTVVILTSSIMLFEFIWRK